MRLLVIFMLSLSVAPLGWADASRSFDGANDDVGYGNNYDVTTGDVSFCAWMKLTEDASTDWVAGKKLSRAQTSAGYTTVQNTSDFQICQTSDGTLQQSAAGTTDIDGSWFWCCCTWDGTADDLFLYVNGTNEASDTAGDVGSLTTTQILNVGEANDGGDDVNGLIAYVQIFSKVLTAADMEQLRHWPGSVGDSVLAILPLLADATEIDWATTNTGTVAGSVGSSDGPPVLWSGLPL